MNLNAIILSCLHLHLNLLSFYLSRGQIRYLVLPTRMKKLPPEVLALIQTGLEDKSCPYNECTHHFPTEIQLRAHIKRVHEGYSLVSLVYHL